LNNGRVVFIHKGPVERFQLKGGENWLIAVAVIGSYFIITHNHGGQINVENLAKGGTRFVIRLPKRDK
jgi:hypothetical protein